MFCKFRAASMTFLFSLMSRPVRRGLAPAAASLAVGALLVAGVQARAEKADRSKPMVIEAERTGTVDLQRQVLVYNGNVVVTQGTMVLRADRVELRELPDGYREASAVGGAGRQATWRQRRDGLDEFVEGSADRIEFDGRTDKLRFIGNGMVRRLRGSSVADEITGGIIVWDNLTEIFRVDGGNASAVNPTGRVRAILSPRDEAASAPPANPGKTTTPSLAPSRGLGEPR